MPEKLWKTTMVIWTDYDAALIRPGELIEQTELGIAYIARCRTERCSVDENTEDGPPKDYFGGDYDDSKDAP